MKHLLLVVLVLTACTSKNKELANQTQNGHEMLYSRPEAPATPEEGVKTIVIASTNDIQGHYGHQPLTFQDKHSKDQQSISVGGVDYLSSYFKILKETYKNILLVDSGDLLPKDGKNLKAARDFYKALGYDALTVGLTDFNLPVPQDASEGGTYLREFAKISDTPVIISNLYDLKTARGVEWEGTKPYVIKEVDGVKIAVLGMIPDDIASLTPVDNRVGLYVESMVKNTLHFARLVRSLGAQVVVVMTHAGVDCGNRLAQAQKLPVTKVNFEPDKSDVCDFSGVLGEYLNRLPPNLVDVVIGGRHHQKMANLHNGTVLLSGFENGKAFNYVELSFAGGKLLKDKTLVHQPVMVCHEFFKETSDCYTEDPSVDHKEKIPASFLGKTITPDAGLREKFSKFFSSTTASTSSQPVTQLLKDFSVELVYDQKSAGHTQLVVIALTGNELTRLLEERFNEAEGHRWLPNPFRPENNVLHLSVNGRKIEAEKIYRILADIETLMNDHELLRYISADTTRVQAGKSWSTLGSEADSIHVQMAATQRQ